MTSSNGPWAAPAAPTTPDGAPPRSAGRALLADRTELADRVWTVPNALSLLRLLGVPLFLWLLLGPRADGWAVLVLALSGVTDWADGKLARLLDQSSRLGALLDPTADRLYIVAALVALALRQVVPLWLVALLVGRELVLGIALVALRRHGTPPLQVHYLGKAATFLLLYAFPLLLLAHRTGTVAAVVAPVAWALTIWGTALYLLAGLLYLLQAVRLLRAEPRGGAIRPQGAQR